MSDLRDRAIAWRHRLHDVLCDRIEPWALGTHVRATRYPTYYDLNCLRLEHGEAPAEALIEAADRLLGDLAHRKIEVEDAALGERLRPAFAGAGWRQDPLLWLILDGEPDAPEGEYEEVAFASIRALRATWANDFSPEEIAAFAPVEEEVADRIGGRTFIVRRDGEPAAFVLWNRLGDGAEIRLVFVSPAWRDQGIARMLVGAAVRAARAAGAAYVVIVADDEDSPKLLYERIGFVPAWTMWELTRRPTAASP